MAETKLVDMPDGNGGWVKVEVEVEPGKKADDKKQAAARSEAWFEDCNGLISFLWRQGRLYQAEQGLSNEQIAFAVALLQVQCRQTFPAQAGGPEAFDGLHELAWEYYKDNVPDAPKES